MVQQLLMSVVIDRATDVSCSFDTLYFKVNTGEIRGCPTKAGCSINFESSEVEGPDFTFSKIFYQNIKNHVNLYNSFTLIRTTMYIAHGPFISLFNIQENQWLRHYKFLEGNIYCLFKKQTMKGEVVKDEVGVLLENGSIYNNMQAHFFSKATDEIQPKFQIIDFHHRAFTLRGQLIKIAQDLQTNLWIDFMVKDSDNSYRLYTLHYDQLYELQEGLQHELTGK